MTRSYHDMGEGSLAEEVVEASNLTIIKVIAINQSPVQAFF